MSKTLGRSLKYHSGWVLVRNDNEVFGLTGRDRDRRGDLRHSVGNKSCLTKAEDSLTSRKWTIDSGLGCIRDGRLELTWTDKELREKPSLIRKIYGVRNDPVFTPNQKRPKETVKVR